ncbi:MAG: hypothetical protein AB1384_12605 [Actinomycetota bacterium]
MGTCDSCNFQVTENGLHYCRGCGCHLCEECWDEQAFKSYDLCGVCGDEAARDDYWESRFEQMREEGRLRCC